MIVKVTKKKIEKSFDFILFIINIVHVKAIHLVIIKVISFTKKENWKKFWLLGESQYTDYEVKKL